MIEYRLELQTLIDNGREIDKSIDVLYSIHESLNEVHSHAAAGAIMARNRDLRYDKALDKIDGILNGVNTGIGVAVNVFMCSAIFGIGLVGMMYLVYKMVG